MRRSSILISRAYRRYRNRFGPGDDLPFPEQRAIGERLWRPPPLRGTRVDRVEAGGVGAEWVLAPGVTPAGGALYLHGGSYLYGSAAGRRGFASRLSRAGEVRVLTLDYRLAPEDPFPAAVEDTVAAYRWLLDDGAGAKRIVVGGDSAGGGLAVAALVAIRDAGLPLPAGVFLLSPWTDLEMTGASIDALAGVDDVLDRAGLRAAADLYLAGTDPGHPAASPLYADLSGLPPLLIQVGTAEILRDDAVRLAAAARDAGVRVVLDEWPGAGHGFQTSAPLIPEARQAVHQIGVFMRRVLGS